MVLDGKERCQSCGEIRSIKRDKPMKVGEALKSVISNAVCEDRVVAGITETAEAFKRWSLSSVLFCVIESTGSLDIQAKLLEAYCTEHKLKLIKVDSCDKLVVSCGRSKQLLQDSDSEIEQFAQCDIQERTKPVCLLVRKSISKCPTPEEEFVIAFHKTFTYCTGETFPFVRIPE